MKLKVKYFGMLAEVTGTAEEDWTTEATTVGELVSEIVRAYPMLDDNVFQVAQQQELTTLDADLNSGEVALLPPFSGG